MRFEQGTCGLGIAGLWISCNCCRRVFRNILHELAKLPGDAKVVVDLENNKLTANGKDYFFELEESWKQRLLKGLDSIGLTLEHEDEIRKYEENHK